MANETTEHMQIEVGGALATLGSAQVRLQRLLDKADTVIAQQAAKLALQQRLLDSHEHRLAIVERALLAQEGQFDA